jgi:hypothetical protein
MFNKVVSENHNGTFNRISFLRPAEVGRVALQLSADRGIEDTNHTPVQVRETLP